MPLYDFACECGREFTAFRRVREMSCATRLPCPDCGEPCAQSFRPVAVRGNYAKPVELQSMGFIAAPEDVAEHRRRFPDVDLVVREGSAIPVVRSLGQKRTYLKKAGWVDTKDYA